MDENVSGGVESDCLDCPLGSYSEAGASGFNRCGCAAGEEVLGSTYTGCAVGKYKAYAGNIYLANRNTMFGSCLKCPPGSFASSTASVSCTTLPLGSYSPDGVNEALCPITSHVRYDYRLGSNLRLQSEVCTPCRYLYRSDCT